MENLSRTEPCCSITHSIDPGDLDQAWALSAQYVEQGQIRKLHRNRNM